MHLGIESVLAYTIRCDTVKYTIRSETRTDRDAASSHEAGLAGALVLPLVAAAVVRGAA